MKSKDFPFLTEAEARAFIMGVELANDPDLTCPHAPVERKGAFVVYLHDESETDEEEPCPICEYLAKANVRSQT